MAVWWIWGVIGLGWRRRGGREVEWERGIYGGNEIFVVKVFRIGLGPAWESCGFGFV